MPEAEETINPPVLLTKAHEVAGFDLWKAAA